MSGAWDPGYRTEELRHGTEGLVWAGCPICGWCWDVYVRWHKGQSRWLAETWEDCACPDCITHGAVVIGKRRKRDGDPPRVLGGWLMRLGEQLSQEVLRSIWEKHFPKGEPDASHPNPD